MNNTKSKKIREPKECPFCYKIIQSRTKYYPNCKTFFYRNLSPSRKNSV